MSTAPEAISTRIEPLLPRIAAGESAAVKAFIDRYGGLVWSLARRMCPTEAEDAVQDVFVDLWRNADRFDERVAGEATFVAMIARRRLIDRSRQRARRPANEGFIEDAPAARNDPKIEVSEEAAIARDAIEQLTPEQQRVIRLTVMQGLTHEETAAATGLPLGTVKTHARRGLMKVREILENARRTVRVGLAN